MSIESNFSRQLNLSFPSEASATKSSSSSSTEKKTSSLFEKIKAKFPSMEISSRIKDMVVHVFMIGVAAKNLAFTIIASDIFKRVFKALLSTDHAVTGVNKEWKYASELNTLLRWGHFLSLLSVPSTLWDIGKKTYEMIRGYSSWLDNVLWIISDVGALLSKTVYGARGLLAVGLVSAKSIAFTIPLNIVSMIFETANVLIGVYSMGRTHILLNRVKKIYDSDDRIVNQKFVKMMDFLTVADNVTTKEKKHHYYMLKENFHFKGSQINRIFRTVQDSAEQITEEKQNVFIKILKRRVIEKQLSTALRILSATIESLSAVIFIAAPLLCPPLLPLAFICVAISSGVAIFQYGFDWVTECHFSRALESFVADIPREENLDTN